MIKDQLSIRLMKMKKRNDLRKGNRLRDSFLLESAK